MEYALDYFDRLLETHVGPVAAAFDGRPPDAGLEEGRRDAVARAAAIRAGLAEAYTREGDLAAVYEAARSLLGDLLGELAADARHAAPAARAWAAQVVSRAVARGAAS